MDTTLTIAVCSTLLPIVASILAVKGSPKRKTAYLHFLYLSLGLMVGLFINHIVSGMKTEIREVPVVPPTLLAIGDSLDLGQGISIKYNRYEISTAIRYFVLQGDSGTQHLIFSVAGQQRHCVVDGTKYLVMFIAGYPLQNDAVRLAVSRLEEH